MADDDSRPTPAPETAPKTEPDTVSDPQADPTEEGGGAPETDVQESDPNADSAVGLGGEMGISSERVGELRGSAAEGTYGAMSTHRAPAEVDPPPEQSADPATGEPHPDQPILKDHGPRSGG
ncbi:MAG: hypothetical protein ABI873_12800 [Marmoricola sp.]